MLHGVSVFEQIWNVSNMTHCNLLKHLYGGQLLQRFASFYCAITKSDNNIVNLCSNLCNTSGYVVASNRRYLLKYINNDGSLFKNKIVSADILKNKIVSINASTNANNVAFTIIELCAIRDNLDFQNIFNDTEIRLLIEE